MTKGILLIPKLTPRGAHAEASAPGGLGSCGCFYYFRHLHLKGGREGGREGGAGGQNCFCFWKVGTYGCHFDRLDELDKMRRTRRRGGREGGKEGKEGIPEGWA